MKKTITKLFFASLITVIGMETQLHAQAPVLLIDSVGNGNASRGMVAGNLFYFQRDGYVASEKQLWITDGTAAGTQMIRDSFYYEIRGMASINNVMYFFSQDAFNAAAPLALWTSDGTPAGTTVVKTFPGYTGIGYTTTVIDNIGYFYLNNGIWKTDGTDLGTVEIKPSIAITAGFPKDYFFKLGNEVAFFTSTGSAAGYSALWKTNGTDAGTTRVKDSVMYTAGGNTLGEVAYVNGILFYTTSSGANYNLWRTDGTASGTYTLTSGYISSLTTLNGMLYFKNGFPGSLYQSDGTVSGTTYVSGVSSIGSGVATFGNSLILAGKDSYDWEPYISNGSAAGTVLLKDIYPGSSGSYPLSFTQVGNMMSFVANDGTYGNQIWKTDGTTSGTVMAYSTADTMLNNSPVVRAALNGYLLFIYDASPGDDLYSILIDPTATGISNPASMSEVLNAYPNPSSGIFQLKAGSSKYSSLKVYDLIGKVVYSTADLKDEILDLRNLPSGIYILQTQCNNEISTQKLIIQK